GDHLERAPARLAHPALVRVLLEVLDPLVLVVALGVVDVGAALAVGEGRDPAGLEHAHHHRGARARQARHHDHRVAVAATTPPGPQAHSVTPNRPFRPKPASRETPKKVARTPSSPPGSGPRLRAGWARAIVSTAESRGRGGSLGYRDASQVRVRLAGTLRTSPPTAQPLVIRPAPTTSVSWWSPGASARRRRKTSPSGVRTGGASTTTPGGVSSRTSRGETPARGSSRTSSSSTAPTGAGSNA